MEVESAVDFGCGPGWYVAALRQEAISIMGYDGNPHVEEFSRFLLNNNYPCKAVDLTDELISDEPFDLILCLNVGEYIPAEHEEQLVRNIVNNAKKYIIISWATHRQEGDAHINPRSNEYIIQLFSKKEFAEIISAKNYLREQATSPRFKNTILVFQKMHIPVIQ